MFTTESVYDSIELNKQTSFGLFGDKKTFNLINRNFFLNILNKIQTF